MRYSSLPKPRVHAISFKLFFVFCFSFFFAKYARVSSKAIERFGRSNRRGKATKEIKQLVAGKLR